MKPVHISWGSVYFKHSSEKRKYATSDIAKLQQDSLGERRKISTEENNKEEQTSGNIRSSEEEHDQGGGEWRKGEEQSNRAEGETIKENIRGGEQRREQRKGKE